MRKKKSAKALKTNEDKGDDQDDVVEKFNRWLVDVEKKSFRTASDYCISVRSFFCWEEARRPLDFEANRMFDFLAPKPVLFPSPVPWDQSHPLLDTSVRPPRCNSSKRHHLANGLSAFLRFMSFELEAEREKFDVPPTPENGYPENPFTVAELHIAEMKHQVRELGRNEAKTILRIGPKVRNRLRAARSIDDEEGPFLESEVFAEIVDRDPAVDALWMKILVRCKGDLDLALFRIRNSISDPEERLWSKAGREYDSDNGML